jgi:hypothetical protein
MNHQFITSKLGSASDVFLEVQVTKVCSLHRSGAFPYSYTTDLLDKGNVPQCVLCICTVHLHRAPKQKLQACVCVCVLGKIN